MDWIVFSKITFWTLFEDKRGIVLPSSARFRPVGSNAGRCGCKKRRWFRKAGRRIPGGSPSGLSERKRELSSKFRTSSAAAPPRLGCDLLGSASGRVLGQGEPFSDPAWPFDSGEPSQKLSVQVSLLDVPQGVGMGKGVWRRALTRFSFLSRVKSSLVLTPLGVVFLIRLL